MQEKRNEVIQFLREKLENTSGQKTNKQQNNKKSDDIQMIAQVLDSNLLIFQQIYEYTFQSKREFQIALQQEGKKLFNSEQFLQKSIQEIQNMAFKMAEKANYYKYRKGEIVFQQGDKAQYFYIVMNGNASAYIKKPKHLIKKMQNQERKLLNIIKEINKQINIYKQEQKQQKVDQMLKKLEEYKKQIDQLQNQEEAFLLDNIPSNSLEKYRTVYKNNINMSDKEQNNEMKIENASSIHNNKVNHEKNNQPIKKDSKIHKKTEIFQENQFQITSKVSQFFKVKTYNQWEHFGEIPFIARNSKHSMTVIADEELEVIYLDKKHFSTIFSEYYRVINFEAFLISQFFIIPGHYNQVKDDILNLSLQFQKQEYRIRDIVFNEGDKADLVYLIKKGQVILTHYQQPQVSNNESRNITKQLVEQGSIKNMNNYTNEKNLDSLINQTTKKKLKRTLEKSRGKILTEGQFFGYEDIFQSNNVEPLRSYEAAANSEKVELLTISQSKLKHFGVSEIQDIFADQIKNQQKFLEPFKRQQEKALQIIENNIRKQITENFLKAQKINQEENNIIKFTEQFQSLPDSANHDKALLPKIQKSVYQKYVEQVRFKNMNNIITRKFFSDDSKETKLTPLQINNIVSQRNYKQKFLLYEGDKQKHINQYQMISEFQQNLNQKPQLSIVDLDKDIQEEQKRAFLLNNQKVLLEYEELFESANVGLLNNLQKLEDKKSKIPFLKDKIEYQKVINKIKEKSDFKQLIQQTYLLNQGNKQFEQLYSEGQQINKFFQDKVYEDLPKRKDILIDFVNKNVIKEVDESNLNDDSSNQYLQQSNFNKYTNINSKQNMSMSYNEYNKIKQKQVGVLLNQYQKEENQITQNQSNKQTNFNKNYNQYFNTTIDTIEMDDQSSAHMLASNQLKGRISFKKNSYIGSDHNLNNYSRKDLRINSVDIQEEEQQLISEMYQNSLAQSQKQLAIQNIIKNESKPLGLQQKKLNNILQSSGNLYQNYKCKGQNAISPQKRPSILQYIQPRNQELNNSYSSHTNLISLQNSKQNINYKVKKKKIGLNQTDRQIYSKLSSQNMNTNIKNIPGIQKVKSKIYGNHQNIQGKIQKSQVSSSENNSNYNMFESSKQISKSNKNLFASQKTNVLDMSDSNRKYFKKIKNVQSNESLNINKSESTNIFNNSSTTQKIYHKYSEDGNWRFLQEIEKQKEITKNAQYFQKQQKLLDSRNDKSQKNLENVTKDFPLQKRRNLDANILQNAQDTIQKQQQQLKDFQYKKLFKQGQTNAKISNIQLQNKNPIYSYSRLKIEQSKTEDKNFFVNKIPPINSQFQLPDKIPSNVSTNKLKKFIDMVAIKKNQQFPQINQGSQQNNLKNQKIQINKKRVFKGLMKKINLPSNISNDNFKNKQHKPLSSVDLEKSNQMAQNKNQNSSSKLKTFCSNLLSPDIFIRTYNLQIQNNNPQNHLQNKSRPVLNTNSCKQIQTNNSKEAISPIQMHSSNQQIIQNKSQNRSSIVNDITQKQNEQIKHNGSQMDLSLRINQQNIDTQSQDNTPKKLMKHLEKKQTNQEISQVQLIQQSENQPLRYNLKIQKIQSDNDEAEFINENNYTSYYGNKDEIEQTQATQTKNYLQININGSQNMNQNMSGNYLQGGSIISHSQLTSKNISPSYKKSSSIKDLKKQLEQNQLEYQLQQQQFQQQKQQQQQQQQQQSFNLSHIFNFNFSSETQNQQNIQFNSNVQTSHLQSQQIQLQDVVEEREEENKSEVSTNKFYIKKQSMSSFQNNMTPTDKMKQLQLENQLNKYQFQQFDHDYRNFDKQHVNLNQNNNEINDDDLIEKISQIQSSSSLSSKSHNSKSDSDLEQLQQSLEFGFSQVDMKQQNKQQQNLNEKNNDEILIQIDKGSENNSNLISNENRINNKSIKLQQDLTNVNNNISTSYKNTNKLVVNNSYYEYQDASSFFNIAPQQSEK